MTRYSIHRPGCAAYAHTDNLAVARKLRDAADQRTDTGHIVFDHEAGAVVPPLAPEPAALKGAPALANGCEECDEAVPIDYRVLVEAVGDRMTDRRVLHEAWMCSDCARRVLPEWAL